MKKKSILLLIATLLMVFSLSACSKAYNLSKAKHDNIIEAGINEYIALDNEKYYLYCLNNSKKITQGYDYLAYVDRSSVEYLLAYNSGDFGHSIVKNDGNIILQSDENFKITNASLVYDYTNNENEKPCYNFYGFVVNFTIAGRESSALYYLDGTCAQQADEGRVEIVKDIQNTDVFSIVYVNFNVYDKQGGIITRKVLNKDFVSIYEINFDRYKIFSSEQTFKASIGYLAYVEKEFASSGEEIYSKVYYDVYCQDASYTRFENVTSLHTYGNGTALFAKKENSSFLFSENGLIKEFSQNATAENNNIKVALNDGFYDIYKYDGTKILENVRQSNGYYIKQIDNLTACYSYEGKQLFDYDIETYEKTENKRFINANTVSEVVKLTYIGGKTLYKFYLNGELVKDYDSNYTYMSADNGIYIFYTLKDEVINYYYYFNVYGATEFKIQADTTGLNSGKFDKVLEYKYYTEKNSNNINFYENAVATLTPYNGRLIPGYALPQGGYFNITHQSFGILKAVVLKMEYDVYKVQSKSGGEVYVNTNERRYAYYIIKNSGKAPSIELIYTGYNKMLVNYNSNNNLFCFSTTDRFSDPNSYNSFVNLSNRTFVYDVVTNETGYISSFTKRAEIPKSNMIVYNENYIIGTDYYNGTKNFLYTVDGNKVLDAKYRIADIKGKLAKINVVDITNNGSFGVYDLEKKKVIEDCDKFTVNLLGGGFYAIGKLRKTGETFTIKNHKGNTIQDKVVSYDFIGGKGDQTNEIKYLFFKMNLGKNQLKLLKIDIDN